MKMNPSHKKTLILVIVLLLCAAFASFWTARQNQKNDAAVAVITYQGKDIRTVDLSTVNGNLYPWRTWRTEYHPDLPKRDRCD